MIKNIDAEVFDHRLTKNIGKKSMIILNASLQQQ